jgi:HAD superfamily hydrolase (TIGR01509 family)
MFDAFLAERSKQTDEPFRLFELPRDCAAYVDSKCHQGGVQAFLPSRLITLPDGSRDDPPTALTIYGLGTRKNDLVLELIRTRSVDVYQGSIRFVEGVRAAGLGRAVVSASKNCREVLIATGIEHLFQVRIDGLVPEREGLRGKPAPDMFLAAARALGADAAHSAVFQDAVARVEAGRAAAFRVGKRRPRRPAGRVAQPRRRPGRERPQRALAAAMIEPSTFPIESWAVAEPTLRLDLLAQTESIFALSNGHIGARQPR